MKEKNSSVQKINNCEVCLSKLKGPELDFGENDGYVVELYFTKAKTNNEENYRRFYFCIFC